MNFRDFLKTHIKDNGCYQFINISNKQYVYTLNGYEATDKINVDTRHSWRGDIEAHSALHEISVQLTNLLGDKKFIEKNLFLINSQEYEHNTNDSLIEYIPSKLNSIDQARINTGNLVGYVTKKYNNNHYSINVTSRFGDSFLKHLIASTDGFIEIPNSGDTEKSDMAEWLLVFLWKVKLKHAYRLGLPKEYSAKREKTVSFRGNLEINEVTKNPDFIPPCICNFREHSYDNSITQLVANTFRFIRNKELISECNKLKLDFVTATEGKIRQVNELLSHTEIKNPYYNDYKIVADLSKRIIRRETADFAGQKENFSAFFFDVSILFEYFIRKVLIRKGFILEKKNQEQYTIPSGGNYNNGKRRLFPDIIIKNDDGSVDIYDVKYKRYDFTFGVSREDLFQINTYIGQASNYGKINKCGFIFPIEEKNKDWNKKDINHKLKFAGFEIDFEILFFKVPDEKIENYSLSFYQSIESFNSKLHG